jgi:hypothetical protein
MEYIPIGSSTLLWNANRRHHHFFHKLVLKSWKGAHSIRGPRTDKLTLPESQTFERVWESRTCSGNRLQNCRQRPGPSLRLRPASSQAVLTWRCAASTARRHHTRTVTQLRRPGLPWRRELGTATLATRRGTCRRHTPATENPRPGAHPQRHPGGRTPSRPHTLVARACRRLVQHVLDSQS